MRKKQVIFILTIIVFLGAFLRLYKLGEFSFAADEFLDINSSYAYFKTGSWQSWDFNLEKVNNENVFAPRDERAWIYKWQVAQLFYFLPPTEQTARLVSVFWGIATILVIFFIARDLTKKSEIGLIAAFLFATSVSGIIFDRRLRMYAMFFPIFLLFSWGIFKFLESRYEGKSTWLKNLQTKTGFNFIFLPFLTVFGALSFHLHQLSGNIALILGVYLLWQFFLVAYFKKSFFNKYFWLLVGGIFSLTGIYFLHPEIFSAFLAGLRFFEDHWTYVIIAWQDYSLLLAAIFFMLGGFFYLWKKADLKKEAAWLKFSFGAPFLASVFLWNRNAGEQYLFFAKSFLIILIATGIWALGEFMAEKIKTKGEKYRFAILALTLAMLPDYAYFFQNENVYNQTSKSENPNYRNVFGYFKKNHSSGDVLITRNFRNYYWSGAKVKVFDFGGEMKRTKVEVDDLKDIVANNSSGWFIFSGNDENYISKEARVFAEKNFEKISNVEVRGDIAVYRWSDMGKK